MRLYVCYLQTSMKAYDSLRREALYDILTLIKFI
jgi:hypothetical protein